MRWNFWTVLGITLLALTVVFWIIPACFDWQKNEHEHEEKMIDKAIELERVKHDEIENKPKKGFGDRVIEFFGKTIAEIGPTMAGKMIGGM